MGRLVEFSELKQKQEGKSRRSVPALHIPSVAELYNEDVITVGDDDSVTVTDLKKTASERTGSKAIISIEYHLVETREDVILNSFLSEARRHQALAELARHTFVVATTLNDPDFIDYAHERLINTLGMHGAAVAIENITLKNKFEQQNPQ